MEISRCANVQTRLPCLPACLSADRLARCGEIGRRQASCADLTLTVKELGYKKVILIFCPATW